MNVNQIDEENSQFVTEHLEDVESGTLSVKEILGMNLSSPLVYIPILCPYSSPLKGVASSIYSLSPLYNTIIHPVVAEISDTKVSEANFQKVHGIPLNEFLTFIEKGHIIPYFEAKYGEYDQDVIKRFLEPGYPRISNYHMGLIKRHNFCALMGKDCKKCVEIGKQAAKDLAESSKKQISEIGGCAKCLIMAYSMGIDKQKLLLETRKTTRVLCTISDAVVSRNLDATIKTDCTEAVNDLSLLSSLPEPSESIDAIVRGLRVKYTPDLDLGSYLDLLDGKTTRAIREITKKIMEDPYAAKYSEHLNSKIVEFNREIEQVGKSRTAKFYHAVSDIAVYGGSKFVERQTESYVKSNKKELHKVSEWIASKFMDFHAKVTGKDWTIAQLYRTRCKIGECRKPTEANKNT